MTIEVTAEPSLTAHVDVVRRTARRAAALIWEEPVELGIRLVGNRAMAELNQTYRHKDGPTDVLSFPSEEPGYLGDVALCVPVARAQARALGHDENTELKVLVVHALAHLCGLDHERSHDEAILQAEIEMGLLSALGVPVEAALARRGV